MIVSRPPTANQMARAADVLNRFRYTSDLSAQDASIVEQAAYLIGMAAIVKQAES